MRLSDNERPLAYVKEKLGKYPFSLLSDAPNGRVWCYIPTGQLVDDDEAIRAIEEAENPMSVLDYQI